MQQTEFSFISDELFYLPRPGVSMQYPGVFIEMQDPSFGILADDIVSAEPLSGMQSALEAHHNQAVEAIKQEIGQQIAKSLKKFVGTPAPSMKDGILHMYPPKPVEFIKLNFTLTEGEDDEG